MNAPLRQPAPEGAARPLVWEGPADRDGIILPAWRAALYASPSGRRPINLRIAFEIAALADRTGSCSAANRTLASLASTDEPRAKDAIAELERDGLVIRQPAPKSSANRTGRRILLALPRGVEVYPPSETSRGVELCHLRGAEVDPPKQYEHSPGDFEAEVRREARRVARRIGRAGREFRDAVEADDLDGIEHAARLMRDALDVTKAPGAYGAPAPTLRGEGGDR
ncbi:MAG: hypothetical protein JNM13_14800 [Hyphomicrobiaceae bacterium]|nr:hypothetical protein [Hyphomicrobiaceae bacterium]